MARLFCKSQGLGQQLSAVSPSLGKYPFTGMRTFLSRPEGGVNPEKQKKSQNAKTQMSANANANANAARSETCLYSVRIRAYPPSHSRVWKKSTWK